MMTRRRKSFVFRPGDRVQWCAYPRSELKETSDGHDDDRYRTGVVMTRRGRPPSGNARDVRIVILLREQERRAWQLAADAAGQTLSDYVRMVVGVHILRSRTVTQEVKDLLLG